MFSARRLCLLLIALVASRALGTAATSPAGQVSDDAVGPVLLILIVGIVLLVAIMVAAAALALLAALLALGVISSSFVVGFLARSPRAGFRAAVVQGAAVGGVPLGMVAFWVGCWVMKRSVSLKATIVLGGISGAAGGAASGMLLLFLLGVASRWIRPPGQEGFPVEQG